MTEGEETEDITVQMNQSSQTPGAGRASIDFHPKSAKSQIALKQQNTKQREHQKTRYPQQALKLSTVSMSARPRPTDNLLSTVTNCVEPSQVSKVITWDQATNARPPLRIDMEGPGPCTYTPVNKPPRETNAPAFSFGRRSFVEKVGGARTSWEKTWFQNSHVWHQKADFTSEKVWPSPPAYKQESCLGPHQACHPGFPAYSIGVRRGTTNKNKKDAASVDPSPNNYQALPSALFVLPKAPSFSHGLRRGGTVLWSQSEGAMTPGPGAYQPHLRAVKQHNPSFSIQGIRREKVHECGPFATF